MVLPYPYYLFICLSTFLSFFFFFFCLPLSIGLVCKSFDDYQKRTVNVYFFFSSIVIKYLIDTVSKREITCDCTIFLNFGLGRSFFVCCLAHRGSTVGFLLLQCSSGVVRHPRDLQVSVATHFCRVLIFASS